MNSGSRRHTKGSKDQTNSRAFKSRGTSVKKNTKTLIPRLPTTDSREDDMQLLDSQQHVMISSSTSNGSGRSTILSKVPIKNMSSIQRKCNLSSLLTTEFV